MSQRLFASFFLLLIIIIELWVSSPIGADDVSPPSAFRRQFPITMVSENGLNRIALPLSSFQASQTLDFSDLVVINHLGEIVPGQISDPPSLLSFTEAENFELPFYGLEQERGSDLNRTFRVSDSRGRLELQIDKGLSPEGEKSVQMVLDVSEPYQKGVRLGKLIFRLAPNQSDLKALRFRLEASHDLSQWQNWWDDQTVLPKLNEAGDFRVELNMLDLAPYLRIIWLQASPPVLSGVGYQSRPRTESTQPILAEKLLLQGKVLYQDGVPRLYYQTEGPLPLTSLKPLSERKR